MQTLKGILWDNEKFQQHHKQKLKRKKREHFFEIFFPSFSLSPGSGSFSFRQLMKMFAFLFTQLILATTFKLQLKKKCCWYCLNCCCYCVGKLKKWKQIKTEIKKKKIHTSTSLSLYNYKQWGSNREWVEQVTHTVNK